MPGPLNLGEASSCRDGVVCAGATIEVAAGSGPGVMALLIREIPSILALRPESAGNRGANTPDQALAGARQGSDPCLGRP
jgi:hypothetical protein